MDNYEIDLTPVDFVVPLIRARNGNTIILHVGIYADCSVVFTSQKGGGQLIGLDVLMKPPDRPNGELIGRTLSSLTDEELRMLSINRYPLKEPRKKLSSKGYPLEELQELRNLERDFRSHY